MSLTARVQLLKGSLDLRAEITAESRQVVALLGPNAAGKTTLLRALAGLVPISHGSVTLDDLVLDDTAHHVHVPTENRPIGVVFQDYLLFPHLSALDNVAFGLRTRGRGRKAARAAALTWLGRMGLVDQADARPRALSGGQAQRVALARALATEPRLLLLDEPLAAMDAGARAELRRELGRHLAAFEGTCLVVTHDPIEAMTLADRLVVMDAGRVVQSGPPADVAARPRSPYVADLLGLNLYRGRARGTTVEIAGGMSLTVGDSAGSGREVFAVLAPRAVSLHRRRPEGSPRNVWAGVAGPIELVGERVRVQVGGPLPIVAEITPAAVAELRLGDGGPVFVSVKATEIDVYPV